MSLNFYIISLAVGFLFSFSACKSKKATGSQVNLQEQITKAGSADARLVVSFYSTGTGASIDKRETFKAWISDYARNNSVQITPREKAWGREGEYDFCFFFEGWTEKQVKAFTDAARKELSGVKNVHFLENQKCRE